MDSLPPLFPPIVRYTPFGEGHQAWRPRRPSTPPELLRHWERGREANAVRKDFENLVYNLEVFIVIISITYGLHMRNVV